MRSGCTGALARSLAGHDRESLYIIIREEGEYVFLADGKIRPVSRPKRKSRKHMQIIHDREETAREALLAAGHLSDDAVRQHLKRYRRESQP